MTKSTLSLPEALALECPHCAVSEFLMLWQAEHNCSASILCQALAEVICDVIINEDSLDKRCELVALLATRLKQDLSDIVTGQYKTEALEELKAREGGLH